VKQNEDEQSQNTTQKIAKWSFTLEGNTTFPPSSNAVGVLDVLAFVLSVFLE
jgi:hypothetical protein